MSAASRSSCARPAPTRWPCSCRCGARAATSPTSRSASAARSRWSPTPTSRRRGARRTRSTVWSGLAFDGVAARVLRAIKEDGRTGLAARAGPGARRRRCDRAGAAGCRRGADAHLACGVPSARLPGARARSSAVQVCRGASPAAPRAPHRRPARPRSRRSAPQCRAQHGGDALPRRARARRIPGQSGARAPRLRGSWWSTTS